jgi:hypothetical protein
VIATIIPTGPGGVKPGEGEYGTLGDGEGVNDGDVGPVDGAVGDVGPVGDAVGDDGGVKPVAGVPGLGAVLLQG